MSEVSNSPHGGASATPLSAVQRSPAPVANANANYDWDALDQWISEGSGDENRAAALPAIHNAFQPDRDGIRWLCLSDVRCRTLPPIPPGTQFVDAPRSLTRLSLPEGVTHVDCRHAKALTEFHFPESLRWLNLSGVPMKALPPLPDGLRHLSAIGCGIETLPATWPREIYVELNLNPVTVSDPSLIGTWLVRGEVGLPYLMP